MNLSDYYTTEQAAARLGIHPESLRRLTSQGKAPAEKVWGRWLFPRAEFEVFAGRYSPDHKGPAAQRKHARRIALRDAIQAIRGEK